MPCVADVVSENVLRVPNDTSTESVCRMLAGLISERAAAISGLLESPIRRSIVATGPDDGLSVDTFAMVAGAPHAAAVAAHAYEAILNAFTVLSRGESAKLWAPFRAGKRRSVRRLDCGRGLDVRFGP